MVKRKDGEDWLALETVLERLEAEVTPLIPKADRTEERVLEATLYRLALTFPEVFETLRKSARAARPKDRELVAMLEEIHGELWEQPPWTSDRPIPFEGVPDVRGRPMKGRVIRYLETDRLSRDRAQLDALTARLNRELAGGPWHRETDETEGMEDAEEMMTAVFGELPDEDERRAPDTLRSTVEDILYKLMNDVTKERKRRTARVHRPQEWAARALLVLWRHPAPVSSVPWADALALLNVLTRGKKAKRSKSARGARSATPKGFSRG